MYDMLLQFKVLIDCSFFTSGFVFSTNLRFGERPLHKYFSLWVSVRAAFLPSQVTTDLTTIFSGKINYKCVICFVSFFSFCRGVGGFPS